MSFSCEIKGKNGKDLLEKYGINSQLLGIARNSSSEEDEDYNHIELSEIRGIFCNYSKMCGRSITREQSQELIVKAQECVIVNLNCLKMHSCPCCRCPDISPKSWDINEAKRFLSIPINEVYKAYGDY